jgi:O-antigen/teichoic acid export membrane protein
VSAAPARQGLRNSSLIVAAEALLVPTGLITAALLTRALGPRDYGLLALAGSLVMLLEWSIAAMLARPTVKLVGEAEDWRGPAAVSLQLHLAAGLAAGVALVASAGLVAGLLDAPALAPTLRLYALELPIAALASAHRSALTGVGAYAERAIATAARWVARLALVAGLLYAGLAVAGAILATIAATGVELALARRFIRPPLRSTGTADLARWWRIAAPLALAALGMRLFERLDLFMLKGLGGTLVETGIYGAAQNITAIVGLLGAATALPLLSSLAYALRSGQRAAAERSLVGMLRVYAWILPALAAMAGAAGALLAFLLGPPYRAGGLPLALLLPGSLALATAAACASALIAAQHDRLPAILFLPFVPVAALLLALFIPRWGMPGAAAASTLTALAALVVHLAAVQRTWGMMLPAATLPRVLAASAAAFAVSALLPGEGIWVVPRVAAAAAAGGAVLLALGEFSREELAAGRAAWRAGLKRSLAALHPQPGES